MGVRTFTPLRLVFVALSSLRGYGHPRYRPAPRGEPRPAGAYLASMYAPRGHYGYCSLRQVHRQDFAEGADDVILVALL